MFSLKIVVVLSIVSVSVFAQSSCNPTTSSSALLTQCDSCPTIEVSTAGQGVAVNQGGVAWTFPITGSSGTVNCNSVSFSVLNPPSTWVVNGTDIYSSGSSSPCSVKSRFQPSTNANFLLGKCIRLTLSGSGGFSIARRVGAVNAATVAPTGTTPSVTVPTPAPTPVTGTTQAPSITVPTPAPTPVTGNSPCPTDGNSIAISATGVSPAFCWYHPQGQVLNYVDAHFACAQRSQHLCTLNEFLSVGNTNLNNHIIAGSGSATILSWWVDPQDYPLPFFANGDSLVCASTEDISRPAVAPAFIHYGPDADTTIYQGVNRNAMTHWCNNIPISWACCGPQGSYPNSA